MPTRAIWLFALALTAACGGRSSGDDAGNAVGAGGNAGTGSRDASVDADVSAETGATGAGGSTGSGGVTGSGGQSGSSGRGGSGGDPGRGGSAGLGGSGGSTGGADAGHADVCDAGRSDVGCITSCNSSGQWCGIIGDNCGGVIDCGACRVPFLCGLGGIPNVCGLDLGDCTPAVCNGLGGRYCGVIGNGCGGRLDCGECPPGESCGATGVAHVCTSLSDGGDGGDGSTCAPTNGCADRGYQYCGRIGDGCDRALDCGTCPTGQVCGLRVSGVCAAPCPLCDRVPKCDDGGSTTIRGTVFSAALANPDPVSGAQVYIPNLAPGTKLPPLADGPFCDQCDPPPFDAAIASMFTHSDGTFVLNQVPAGTAIPLIVQLGRWRRQITVDVVPCVDNVLPAGTVRLPRSKSEGDIPLTAIATGNADRVQCLVRKMGVEDAEFSNPSGAGRIHFYRANGAIIDANTPADTVLKGTTAGGGTWSQYSQVLLPCEGLIENETPEALGNFTTYANAGGRVLAVHDSFVWLHTNEPFASIATWSPGAPDPVGAVTATVGTAFPRGVDFAQWLALVGALSTPNPPSALISDPHGDLRNARREKGAETWLQSFNPETTQLVTIDTPVLASPDKTCGRVAFSDFHIGSAAPSGSIFPAECDPDLAMSPQEKVLEYTLFDLAGCMNPKTDGPLPPRPPPLPPGPPKGRPPFPPPPPAPDLPPLVPCR